MATTYEEVLALFRETDRKFQESRAEAAREFAELRQFVRELSQETDRKFQETDRKFQETDRKIERVNEQLGRLGNRLGDFVEGLVRPAVVRLFQERGIAIREVHPDVSVDEPGGGGMQIDLLVVNGEEAILIEVKSKLTQRDVDEHLERMGKFKRLMPRYADIRALGAVAAMVIPPEVGRYAYRRGLFVLAQSGASVVILNDAQFQPRAW